MPSRNTAARARITIELLADPARGDYLVARVPVQPVPGAAGEARPGSPGLIAPAPPAVRARQQDRPPVHPYSPELPRQPDFSQGRCRAPGVNPDWWTSCNQEERQGAIWVRKNCPVLGACQEWSLSLPVTDTTTYGGMTANERIRARRERAAAAAVA